MAHYNYHIKYTVNNKKQTSGRLVQKQWVSKYSKEQIEEMEKSGEYTSIDIARMKRQKKMICHLEERID